MNIADKYINTILDEIMKHEGYSNPIQVSDLMSIVPLEDREIRSVVSYLVVEKYYPIGSTSSRPSGFFKIKNANDLIKAIKNLNPRSNKIDKRTISLIKACRKFNIPIPKITLTKEIDSSRLVIHIKESVVFIKNGKD
ncbi:MAG: hypothetical protein JW870_04900 [Candidatus Delongbacteria bacterium]|nr:hypothetical protein [Candidatus Delongbacteria bacterium]